MQTFFDAVGHRFAAVVAEPLAAFPPIMPRVGFFIVVLFWTVLGTVVAIFFLFSEQLYLSFADFFFLSFSGLPAYWCDHAVSPVYSLADRASGYLSPGALLPWCFPDRPTGRCHSAVLPRRSHSPLSCGFARPADSIARCGHSFLPLLLRCGSSLYCWLWPARLALCLAVMPFFAAVGHSFARFRCWRLFHPNAVYTIGFFNRPLLDPILEAVFLFFSACDSGLYFSLFCRSLPPSVLATSRRFLCLLRRSDHLGPCLGVVVLYFPSVYHTALWILILAILFGRLDVFTFFVLFTPDLLARIIATVILPVLFLFSSLYCRTCEIAFSIAGRLKGDPHSAAVQYPAACVSLTGCCMTAC